MHSRRLLQLTWLWILTGSMSISRAQTTGPIAIHGGGVAAGMVTAHIDDMDVEPVKRAPFCATVSTEHTQTFSDGNRIHTSDNSNVCRDSQGRTRREASLNLLGAAPEASTKLITIVDPVAGFRYTLDTDTKVAHRFPMIPPAAKGSGFSVGETGVSNGKGERLMLYQQLGPAGPNMVGNGNMVFKKGGPLPDETPPTTEKLGDQMIEGIRATGTRMTTTIPAGRVGNELPMVITSERWYSPELKATILTRHNDPWAGELKTQFTNLNTSEPDPSLFTVPSDYKVVDEKAGPFLLEKHLLPPAPE